MESYKTQDYTDANDVLSEAEMNAIFEKILIPKKEKECSKKDARCCSCRWKIRENKIYFSAEALNIPYNQYFSVPRKTSEPFLTVFKSCQKEAI